MDHFYNRISYFDFINKFIDHETMTSRPISGFIYGSIVYLTKLNLNLYYLNYLFFPISIIFMYKVMGEFIGSSLSVIITIIYSFSIIGSSIVFSPIMMNSSLAITFYLLSLLTLKNLKGKYYLFLSIFFYILSVLSYEIMLPSIIINAIVIDKKWYIRTLYLILAVSVVMLYREIIEPSLFSNYFHRDQTRNILDLHRDKIVTIEMLRMLFIDIPKGLIRGILSIRYYSLSDFILVFISIIYYIGLFNTEFNCTNKHKLTLISLIGVILSLSIFFFQGIILAFMALKIEI